MRNTSAHKKAYTRKGEKLCLKEKIVLEKLELSGIRTKLANQRKVFIIFSCLLGAHCMLLKAYTEVDPV